MVLRHILQVPDQGLGQRPVGGLGARWKGCDKGSYLGRTGRWGSNPALQMPKERLALIDATDAVVGRGRETVGWAVDVVRDDHPQRCRIGLVQRPELPQVLDGLAE